MSENKTVAVETQMTLPKHIPWIFTIYTAMDGCKRTVSTMFLLYFITEYTGISAVQMAGVLTFARVADLICSLFAGAIVQKSNTRFGAYRPYIVGTTITVWFGVFLQFANPSWVSVQVKLVMVAVGYMADGFAMNFITVAQNGLTAKVAGPNPENRLAITSKRAIGQRAGQIWINAATLPLITLLLNNGLPGYFITVNIYGAVALIGGIILIVVTKEYDKYDPSGKASAAVSGDSLPMMFARFFKDPTLVLLFFVGIFTTTAMQAISGTQSYYFRYSSGNLMYQALSGTISSFISMGASVICPPLARKLKKRGSALFSYSCAAIGYISMTFVINGNPMMFIVLNSFIQVCNAIITSYGINLWLDAAEVQLYETGVDNRTFIMSVNNIPIKIAFIFQTPLVAWILNRVNYGPGADGAMTIPDTGLFVRYFGTIPAILYGIAALMMFFGYKISEQRARECAALNAKAAAERAASESKN